MTLDSRSERPSNPSRRCIPGFTVIALFAVVSACTACGQPLADGTSARISLLYGGLETRTQSSPFASPASRTLREERWISYDKLQHVTFGFLFTVSAQYALTDKMRVSTARATPISAAAGLSVGLAKEVYDWQISPSRRFDGRDLVADLAGVALGTVLILL